MTRNISPPTPPFPPPSGKILLALLAIGALAGLLRFPGLDYQLPLTIEPDAHIVVQVHYPLFEKVMNFPKETNENTNHFAETHLELQELHLRMETLSMHTATRRTTSSSTKGGLETLDLRTQ